MPKIQKPKRQPSQILVDQKIQNYLRESYSRIEDLVESMGNGVVMFDRHLQITLANSAVREMFYKQAAPLTIGDFIKLFPSNSFENTSDLPLSKQQAKIIAEVKQVVVDAIPMHFKKVHLDERVFEMFVTPVRDYNKKVFGGAIILNDISYLARLDEMKTEFLSIAAHQLRAPLGSMRWNLEMVINEDYGHLPEASKDVLQRLLAADLRMINLIDDLLNVSRIDQGLVIQRPVSTDLFPIIQNAITDLTYESKRRSIEVVLKIDDNVPKVFIDPKPFYAVMENLISNAIKYSIAHNTVKVKLKLEGEHVLISVKDQGIGIPIEDQRRIFSKFFRSDNARMNSAEGSGLGLFVVKSYVDNWGGKIWFSSAENRGSTFYISLPLTQPQPKKKKV